LKTVICFDTDDPQGMKDAHAIMDHLCREHLEKRLPKANRLSMHKIAFIKMLRHYGSMCLDGKSSNGLKDTKRYADEIWKEHVKDPLP
tara:strand:- start:81 stop:344 length:264 start_codon:yes stop_codon:yes gene_type:complete